MGEADVTEYGKDMIDFARRVTREEVAPIAQALHDLNRRLEQLQGLAPTVQRVAANQQMSAEQSFAAGLSRAVLDWGVINDDPRFHAWLLTPDDMTGITRQTYLADAEQTLDLNRVVSISKRGSAKLEYPLRPQRQLLQPRQTMSPSWKNSWPPVVLRLRPRHRPRRPKKTYTPADISKFYADKLHGVYKGRSRGRHDRARHFQGPERGSHCPSRRIT